MDYNSYSAKSTVLMNSELSIILDLSLVLHHCLNNSSVGDVIIEEFDVHHESEFSQYMVTPGETYTPTEIHEPSKEEIDLFFNAPPQEILVTRRGKNSITAEPTGRGATPCMGCSEWNS